MMIPSPGASDRFAAAAALDRQLRSPGDDPDDDASGGVTLESGPDVVVTLSKDSAPPSPSTYDASGRMSGRRQAGDPDAPDSMATVTQSNHDDDDTDTDTDTDAADDTAADADAATA